MKLKRLIAGVISAAMMLSIGSTLAFAADADVSNIYDKVNTTEITGMTFTSTLYLSETAVTAPTVSYSYEVKAVDGASYSNADSTIYYAYDSTLALPTFSGDASFTTSDFAANASVSTDIDLDFSGVEFSAPGVYVYEITETASATDAVSANLTNGSGTRYVYVTVKNAADDSGVYISDFIMTLEPITVVSVDNDGNATTTTTEKSGGFQHSYGVTDTDGDGTPDDKDDDDDDDGIPDDDDDDDDGDKIPDDEDDDDDEDASKGASFVITTVAKGDMASPGKDFTFSVAVFEGVEDGTIFALEDDLYVIYDGTGLYYVTLKDSDEDGDVDSYAYTLDAENNKVPYTFTMSAEDISTTIYSVVDGMEFTVSISDPEDAGYSFYARYLDTADTTNWTDISGESDSFTNAVGGDTTDGIDFATVRGYSDDDDGITYDKAFPETGVVLDLLPYVVMVALAGAFITFRVVKSARKDEE